MEINSKEELITLLGDLQGQVVNMQETIDKLSPVEGNADPSDNAKEGEKEEEKEEELSDEEVDEIDQLLQKS